MTEPESYGLPQFIEVMNPDGERLVKIEGVTAGDSVMAYNIGEGAGHVVVVLKGVAPDAVPWAKVVEALAPSVVRVSTVVLDEEV